MREKTTCMVMGRYQNAGQNHNLKIDNKFLERGKQFKYLGTRFKIQDSRFPSWRLKRKMKSGNACYHSVQNILSSSLLFKNLKNKIYRTIIWPVVLYGCETWSVTLKEECMV
jgi:hypothetical protein